MMLGMTLSELHAEVLKLRAEVDTLAKAWRKAEDENDELRAEVERLRALLIPGGYACPTCGEEGQPIPLEGDVERAQRAEVERLHLIADIESFRAEVERLHKSYDAQVECTRYARDDWQREHDRAERAEANLAEAVVILDTLVSAREVPYGWWSRAADLLAKVKL